MLKGERVLKREESADSLLKREGDAERGAGAEEGREC
jgi:hypothetical protein